MTNLPLTYDHHGSRAFDEPFSEIPPSEIDIYLDVDTRIGKQTCGQACAHCWFVNYEKVFNLSYEVDQAVDIWKDLRAQGYNVFPRYTDSFAYEGELMKVFGSAQARTYYEQDHAPGETMEWGEAWTSGQPLLADNWRDLLRKAQDSGYATITMTFHGILNEDLSLQDRRAYPIKGVFHGDKFAEVVRRIFDYNEAHAGKDGFPGFRVGAGVTVGAHNHDLNALGRYIQHMDKLGVSALRFNKFFDHGDRHPQLVLTDSQTAEIFESIKILHNKTSFSLQLGISEDFGTQGISVLGLPSDVGWCRAGRQLFAIVPNSEGSKFEIGETMYECIGDVVGCVNVFEPKLGELIKITSPHSTGPKYKIQFNLNAVKALTRKRTTGAYQNGCFARELMDELSDR